MKDVISRNYKWFVIGLWLAILLTIFSQFIEVCPFNEAFLFTASYFVISYPIVALLSNRLLPIALKSKNLHNFITQLIGLSLVLAALYALSDKGFAWLENKGYFPPSPLIAGFQRPFYAHFFGNLLSAFMTNVAFCTFRFFEVHYKMAQEHAKLRQAHLEEELRFLRAQINPHLIFNVLNHIHILMKKDVDMADELLLKYSETLRYQLYECNKEKVLLKKEVDYLKDVIEVEKMRWGNQLQVSCNWKIENEEIGISPLLLIPFIENAFKHVSRLPSHSAYIDIVLNQTDNKLQLIVENSRSPELIQPENASGLGLSNVKKRLELIYPNRYELAINKTDTHYKTTLSIIL